MKQKNVIALWLGLVFLVIASLLILAPVNTQMLQPMLESFPGLQHRHALAYVLSIGYIFAWELSVVVTTVSLGTAGGFAVSALAGLSPLSSRYRFLIPGAVATIAIIWFVWSGFLRAPTGLSVDVVRLVGQDTWPGIKFLELGARRIAAVGMAASILIFFAMVGLTFCGANTRTGLNVELGVVNERIATLKHLLYLAGLGLAAGVVATAMMLNLHIDFTQLDESAIEIAKLLVRNATLAYGAGFSLLLVLGYAPAAAVLGRWSCRLTQQALPRSTASERRTWRQANELESPLASYVWQIIAVFAPVLTSVLGEPVTRVVTGLLQG